MLDIGHSGIDALYTGFTPPLTTGLLGWGCPWNGVPALQTQNFFTEVNGAAVGVPAYNAGYASFTGGARIVTDVAEPLNMTAYVVARSTDTNLAVGTRPQWFGNRGGAAGGIETPAVVSLGIFLAAASTTTVTFAMSHADAGANVFEQAIITADPTTWRLYCARINNGVSNRLDDLTGGATATNSALNGTRNRSTEPLRVGNNVVGTAGNNDVAMWGVYNVVHTDAERDALAVLIKSMMLDRWGITV